MTRQRGLRAGASILALLLLGSAACRRPLERTKFEKIQLGMTEAEVTEIVGKPDAVTKMRSLAAPSEEGPYAEGPAGLPVANQIMYAYVSGMEFAHVYFEDGRVFGVRFNNEFLKGDWMEGEAPLPASPSDK